MSRREATFCRPALEPLEDRTVPAPVGSVNQNFVDQVYRDVLHRAPDGAGLSFWSGTLTSGQFTRQEVALQIQGSEEGLRTQANDLYLRFLSRPADPVGLLNATNFLRGGDLIDLEAALVGSQEYYLNRAGATPVGFINAAFQDLLGRPASIAESSALQVQLAGTGPLATGTRGSIARGLLTSLEGRTARVNMVYDSFLRRDGDQAGVFFWSQALFFERLDDTVDPAGAPDAVERDDDVILVAAILSSAEYSLLSGTQAGFATIPTPNGGLRVPGT